MYSYIIFFSKKYISTFLGSNCVLVIEDAAIANANAKNIGEQVKSKLLSRWDLSIKFDVDYVSYIYLISSIFLNWMHERMQILLTFYVILFYFLCS